VLLFRPVNLLRVERITNTKRDRNSSRTRTDHRDLRQLARDVFFETKLAAQRDRQHARGVVEAKGERHLKIVGRVLAVRVNKMTFAKGAGLLQHLHHRILRRNQLNHERSPVLVW
jgi:hypothetical protein